MKKAAYTLICLLIGHFCMAQKTPPSPCATPEASQFDFWVGEWDAFYSDTLQPASNTITKPYNNCILQENFYDPNTSFRGMSVSGYNPKTKKWQQTWVDNQGAYIALTGEFKDGKMQLNNEITKPDGKKIQQRMLFYNISHERFDWSWDSSNDDGKTWTVNWKIHYVRKK
jgi:hypothetical protein